MHRFSKNLGEASTNYRRQNCDINKFLTEGSQILGSSVQKSVSTRLPGARDLCTLALSKVVGLLKICIVNAENFIWSANVVHLTRDRSVMTATLITDGDMEVFIAGREVHEIFSVFADLCWMWGRYNLNSH